jgi:DNA anti-recombination protein RmuC
MTEKEVYKKGVALLEEWEDVNYCEHNFKFKDEWLTDKEVVELLNELHEENKELQFQLKECRERKLYSRRKLEEENTHIKNTIKEMYETERTALGRSVLKQLLEAIQ